MKNDERQEKNIVIPGQFRTLAMFFDFSVMLRVPPLTLVTVGVGRQNGSYKVYIF